MSISPAPLWVPPPERPDAAAVGAPCSGCDGGKDSAPRDGRDLGRDGRDLGRDAASRKVGTPVAVDTALDSAGSRASMHDTAMLAAFRAVTAALSQLPSDLSEYDAVGADVVLEIQREIAAQGRLLGARAALVAGQIARRSAPELGSAGLAQRGGFRTPEELVRVTTGSTAGDARRAVRVGVAVGEAQRGGRVDQVTGELFASARPWMHLASRAVAAGALSIDAAEAIRSGLGELTDTVTTMMLTDAVTTLLRHAHALDGLPGAGATEASTPGAEAPGTDPSDERPAGALPLDADRLYRRARELRDELDAEGVADREEQRRAARSLRVFKRPDGTARLVWEMDPETFAIVGESYDQLTSPRRGGPRFVARGSSEAELTDSQSREAERAERILIDPRTTEQLASDGFLELLRVAVETAPNSLIGLRRPSVRVLVTESTLRSRRGHGRLEGQGDLVPVETVERIACSDGVQPITFDSDGQPLDVGREQRLYTRRQRVALAVRDGGCRWPGCERPPAWTEAHHIRHWTRDRGSTDVADGILLCRHHHLLAHNNHWEITRDRAQYWLVPPPDIDPEQSPIPMPSKSGAVHEAMRETARDAVRGAVRGAVRAGEM